LNEAWREGICDTRYMATLQEYLERACKSAKNKKLVAKIDK